MGVNRPPDKRFAILRNETGCLQSFKTPRLFYSLVSSIGTAAGIAEDSEEISPADQENTVPYQSRPGSPTHWLTTIVTPRCLNTPPPWQNHPQSILHDAKHALHGRSETNKPHEANGHSSTNLSYLETSRYQCSGPKCRCRAQAADDTFCGTVHNSAGQEVGEHVPTLRGAVQLRGRRDAHARFSRR